MARGGARPNSGPAKGTKYNKRDAAIEPPKVIDAAQRLNMTPLEYMLAVMNDPTADDVRRDRLAMAAAPYVHAKAEAAQPGKKEQAEMVARNAERGTDWESLLN